MSEDIELEWLEDFNILDLQPHLRIPEEIHILRPELEKELGVSFEEMENSYIEWHVRLHEHRDSIVSMMDKLINIDPNDLTGDDWWKHIQEGELNKIYNLEGFERAPWYLDKRLLESLFSGKSQENKKKYAEWFSHMLSALGMINAATDFKGRPEDVMPWKYGRSMVAKWYLFYHTTVDKRAKNDFENSLLAVAPSTVSKNLSKGKGVTVSIADTPNGEHLPEGVFFLDFNGKGSKESIKRGVSELLYRLARFDNYTALGFKAVKEEKFRKAWKLWLKEHKEHILNKESAVMKLIELCVIRDLLPKYTLEAIKILKEKEIKRQNKKSVKSAVKTIVPPVNDKNNTDDSKDDEKKDADDKETQILPNIDHITDQDILDGNISLHDDLTEGATFHVTIKQKTRSGKFSVPVEKSGKWADIELAQNDERTYTLTDNLGLRRQVGKTFGFEFFVKIDGENYPLSKIKEVPIPKEEKILNTSTDDISDKVFDIVSVGKVEPLQQTNLYADPLYIAASKKKLMNIIDSKKYSSLQDYKDAWEIVLDDPDVFERFIMVNIVEHDDRPDGAIWYELPFPDDYTDLLAIDEVSFPNMFQFFYDETNQILRSNFDGLSDDVRLFLIDSIKQKLDRKEGLRVKTEKEFGQMIDGGDGSKSKELASEYERLRREKKLFFICKTVDKFEERFFSTDDIDSTYALLVQEYGEGSVYPCYQRRRVSFYGTKKQRDEERKIIEEQQKKLDEAYKNAGVEKSSFDEDNNIVEEELKMKRVPSEEVSNANITEALESPEILEVVGQRIRSHAGVIRDSKNKRTSLTNGAEDACNTVMCELGLVNKDTPEDEMAEGEKEVTSDIIDTVFNRSFLLQYKKEGGRFTSTLPIITTMEQHRKNIKEDKIKK